MIDSAIFTKSVISRESQIFTDQIDTSFTKSSTIVYKGTMFHLVSSHIFQIYRNPTLNQLQKKKLIYQFGFKIGGNLGQEESYGYLKYFTDKNDGKQFVGAVKILNSKIWPCVIGSKGKLFSINLESKQISFYKIEDKQFSIGKAFAHSTDAEEKKIRSLMVHYCQGVIDGTFDKFNIAGDIACFESAEGSICAEFKNLSRKKEVLKIQEYNQSIKKKII